MPDWYVPFYWIVGAVVGLMVGDFIGTDAVETIKPFVAILAITMIALKWGWQLGKGEGGR